MPSAVACLSYPLVDLSSSASQLPYHSPALSFPWLALVFATSSGTTLCRWHEWWGILGGCHVDDSFVVHFMKMFKKRTFFDFVLCRSRTEWWTTSSRDITGEFKIAADFCAKTSMFLCFVFFILSLRLFQFFVVTALSMYFCCKSLGIFPLRSMLSLGYF